MKEETKTLITEIMNEDAKDGLYDVREDENFHYGTDENGVYRKIIDGLRFARCIRNFRKFFSAAQIINQRTLTHIRTTDKRKLRNLCLRAFVNVHITRFVFGCFNLHGAMIVNG